MRKLIALLLLASSTAFAANETRIKGVLILPAFGTAGILHNSSTGLVTSSTIVNADVAAGAAIAYSKLALTGSILNADLAGGIAYSKLSLTGSILNADLAGSIAASKLVGTDITTLGTVTAGIWSSTAIGASKGGTGGDSSGSTGIPHVATGTWSYSGIVNADVSGSAAIAYSKLALSNSIVNADVAAGAAIAYSKLALTGAILNADLAGSIAYSKLSLGSSIVNADIAAGAAIAYSKLALTGAVLNADLAGSIADTKLSTISTAGKVSDSALPSSMASKTVTSTFTISNAAGTGTRIPLVSSTGAVSGLANSSDGLVLTLVAGAPAWATVTPGSVPRSQIHVAVGNGQGGSSSGDIKIRNFTNVIRSSGTDITRTARTTTAGEFYTINTTGVYSMYYNDYGGVQWAGGFSLNSSQLSTIINSITATDRLAVALSPNAVVSGNPLSITYTGIFTAGDIVRVHTDGAPNSSDVESNFGIVMVSP